MLMVLNIFTYHIYDITGHMAQTEIIHPAFFEMTIYHSNSL
jgi:hypothetical protein